MLSNIKTVIGLSLKNQDKYILPVLMLWISIVYVILPNMPPLAFLIDLWEKKICLIILPILILILYFIIYYLFIFKKITVEDQNYFFSFPGINENEFIKSPQLILNENILSRFSFKLKLFGNISTKFRNKRFVVIIEKAPTINIYLKQDNANLKQISKNLSKELFYIEQDYELFSNYLSYSIYIESRNAEDTDKLKIYVECEEFIKKTKDNPKLKPKNLIHIENFYLSN